jgi:hypothetical protein
MFELVLVLVIAAVAYVMARRVKGEAVQARRMLVLPAVLVAIGFSELSGAVHNRAALVFLIASAAVSIALGALRGPSSTFSERDGVACAHYTGVSIALWVVSLAVKFGLNLAFKDLDPHAAAAAGNSLLLTLGAGMLLEGAVTLNRAIRTGSRVLWATGKDAHPHTTSRILDDLQRKTANR